MKHKSTSLQCVSAEHREMLIFSLFPSLQLEQLQCELTRVLRERDAYKARYEKLLSTNHGTAGDAPPTRTSNPPSPPPDYFL